MTGITLVLTYACNQDCSYCYQLKNGMKMDFSTAQKAIDYFTKNENDKFVINFYGGEPLLEFNLIKEIIHYSVKQFKKKNSQINFSLTTNGVLLDHEKLSYCYQNGIDVNLSIDGIKEAHEIGRGKNSFTSVEKVLSLYKSFPEYLPNIQSVITPDNVKYLYKSVRYLVSKEISELTLNFCCDQKWNKKQLEILGTQYHKAYKYLIKYKSEGGSISFKEKEKPDPMKPLFKCDAGQDRFAISPDGYIYGCSMHIPWSKKALELGNMHHLSDLCLGHIDKLSGKKFKKKMYKLKADKRMRGQYFFHTSQSKCQACKYISQCELCPVYAMISNQDQYLIPDWICAIKKIENKTERIYWS